MVKIRQVYRNVSQTTSKRIPPSNSHKHFYNSLKLHVSGLIKCILAHVMSGAGDMEKAQAKNLIATAKVAERCGGSYEGHFLSLYYVIYL